MIRFVSTHRDGGTLIGLGITAENVERLKDGKPILVDVDELTRGLPVHSPRIAIFYGEDEDAIARDFERAGVVIGEFSDGRESHQVRRGEP